MADVWHAEWRAPSGEELPVALKRMRPHLSGESAAISLFQAEGQLALRFSHSNIVRALSAGEIGGEPFIALEMIDGVNLRTLWRARTTPLPLGFAAWVTHQVCAALAYAHSFTDENGRWLGLVHGDVTPSNVMIAVNGSVKLLDFGVAREAHDRSERRGIYTGKLGYIAPELLDGADWDHRADLFSLGAVLYEMVTHERLFGAAAGDELLARNRDAAIAPPSTVRPLPARIDRIVMRALARDPDGRYSSASEMARDLEAVLAAEPWRPGDTAALFAETPLPER
jgi:serine/threonine-protein kinase